MITKSYLFCILLPFAAPAQSVMTTPEPVAAERPSVTKLDTLMTIKLSVNSEDEHFTVTGNDFFYDIRPNVSYLSRVNFNYKFISFRVGYIPKIFPANRDNDTEGRTKLFSLEFNMFAKHWNQELQYLKVRGFFLYNTSDYVPGWKDGTDPYIQFPDMKFIAYRGITTYKLNPRFSLKAIRNQTEIQEKSEGSFLGALNYSYYLIDNKSSSASQTSSQKSDNFDALIAFGYIYNYVYHRNWYASAEFGFGCGINYTKLTTRYSTGNVYSTNTDFEYRLKENIRAGYNSTRFFGGMELCLSQTTRDQTGTGVNYDSFRNTMQLFVGYHFNAPRFLKRLPLP